MLSHFLLNRCTYRWSLLLSAMTIKLGGTLPIFRKRGFQL
jgi:hypothetical protein